MAAKKLGLKQRYAHMTRGLDWETTYQPMDKVFPYDRFEGIKIKDWSAWEDPFRLTMDAYWKFQAEKERKLYAVLDAFAQNNGQTKISDGRYANVLKLFLTGVSPLEYPAHRGFAFTGRHLRGVGPRVACQHAVARRTAPLPDPGAHDQPLQQVFRRHRRVPAHARPRVVSLACRSRFFDDARSAGPFEFMIAVGFSFEYVLTNLLFVPFMSGAAYNGDMSTVTFGFSAQSDESRHMTLGIEVIKFLLEQHPDNLPIVQKWVDKWFWRGHKVLGIVAMMMDYMLPKKVMSWREAWDIYFTEAGGSLFQDLARYGLRPPKYADQATVEADHVSHQNWAIFYQYSHAAAFHTWMPDREHLDWLSREVSDHVRQISTARAGRCGRRWRRRASASTTWRCRCCATPAKSRWSTPSRAIRRRSASASRSSRARRYHFCSDGCKDIFDGEPEKYAQSWLPVHQIFQGNCGGATIPDVLNYYRMNIGADNMDYVGSPDEKLWNSWQAGAVKAAE